MPCSSRCPLLGGAALRMVAGLERAIGSAHAARHWSSCSRNALSLLWGWLGSDGICRGAGLRAMLGIAGASFAVLLAARKPGLSPGRPRTRVGPGCIRRTSAPSSSCILGASLGRTTWAGSCLSSSWPVWFAMTLLLFSACGAGDPDRASTSGRALVAQMALMIRRRTSLLAVFPVCSDIRRVCRILQSAAAFLARSISAGCGHGGIYRCVMRAFGSLIRPFGGLCCGSAWAASALSTMSCRHRRYWPSRIG